MASYFQSHRNAVDLYPTSKEGLRNAQLGGVAALIAHGTRHRDEAVIVLPTGTGKTAVLQLTPFLWGAERALVITPARLVREQIAEGFSSLGLLRHLGVLRGEITPPKVVVIDRRMTTLESWESLRDADIVVTTPMSSAPSIDDVFEPPEDLFDLILVDEAHHTPATSYSSLLTAFPDARKALFTATPFRRDKKRLPGSIIYNYPLRDAIRDGTYGKVEYIPCDPLPGQNADIAIATAAEIAFRDDQKSGFNHRLMVRTDSVSRAKELLMIYKNHTGLRVQMIQGTHSLKHVTSVVKKLDLGELDGIICVDMFAEGVDFPRLKLAALHAPHRSLAITLQFIGRFARTNADGLGTAKFIAIPQEIDAEVRSLYLNGANWEELVANLADARIEEEETLRDGLVSFADSHRADVGEIDLTVGSIRPYFHTKVFKVDRVPDFHLPTFLPSNCELLLESVSDELTAKLAVFRHSVKPKWLEVESLADTKNLLYLVHYNARHKLLFINSIEHAEELYAMISESVYPEDSDVVAAPLSHDEISRALRILDEAKFYNVGMRNQSIGNQAESYRTLTGRAADKTVSRTDASTRSRGHVYGGGTSKDDATCSETIGVSTLSKIWSNRYGFIPEFVQWCDRLAIELTDSSPVATGSNIDLLGTGEQITAFSAPPISAVWNEHAYKYFQILRLEEADEELDLTSLDLSVAPESGSDSVALLTVAVDDRVLGEFRFDLAKQSIVVQTSGIPCYIKGRTTDGTLEEFLRIRPPTFFLADFSIVVGTQCYRRPKPPPLDKGLIREFDLFDSLVDITKEFGATGPGRISIHEFTEQEFTKTAADIVIYDHRSGELADYIAITEGDDFVKVELAHCKGSGGARSGSRVSDVYEVTGQIVKCLPYIRGPEDLLHRLLRRLSTGSTFSRGTEAKLQRILAAARKKRFEVHLRLVQPGLSVSKMTESVETVLASASEYVTANTGIVPSFWLSP